MMKQSWRGGAEAVGAGIDIFLRFWSTNEKLVSNQTHA